MFGLFISIFLEFILPISISAIVVAWSLFLRPFGTYQSSKHIFATGATMRGGCCLNWGVQIIVSENGKAASRYLAIKISGGVNLSNKAIIRSCNSSKKLVELRTLKLAIAVVIAMDY